MPDPDELVGQEATEEPVEDIVTDVEESTPEQPVVDEVVDGEGGTEAADAMEPAEPAWQQTLQEAGFSDFSDVDTAVERAVSAIRQRDEQLERLTQQVKFYQDQGVRGHAAPPAPQPEPEPEAEKDLFDQVLDGWEDPRWAEQYIEQDEDGIRTLRDGLDDHTKEKVMAVDRKLRQWGEILQDPRQFASAIDKRVERMIAENFEKGFEQRQTQQQEQAAINTFVNENANWLYQQDAATGQYMRDPISGELLYSKDGEEFLGLMDQFRRDGINSTSKQIQYAQMAHGRAKQAAAEAPMDRRQQVQGTIEQKRQEMLGRKNTRTTQQREFNGVNPESGSGPAGGNTLSFGEETLALMKTGAE